MRIKLEEVMEMVKKGSVEGLVLDHQCFCTTEEEDGYIIEVRLCDFTDDYLNRGDICQCFSIEEYLYNISKLDVIY